MKKVKVKRSTQTTYTLLPERFCTYCGAKGIYEDDSFDYYRGNGTFCFQCSDARPHELWDSASLSKLIAKDPVVVDRREWETEQTEFEVLLEKTMGRYAAEVERNMFKTTIRDWKDDLVGKPQVGVPIVYPVKGGE